MQASFWENKKLMNLLKTIFLKKKKKKKKKLWDFFIKTKKNASELLGKQKADELIEDYFFEKKKRGSFTYDMGEILVLSKAKTSLERAQKFRREIKKIIIKNNKKHAL